MGGRGTGRGVSGGSDALEEYSVKAERMALGPVVASRRKAMPNDPTADARGCTPLVGTASRTTCTVARGSASVASSVAPPAVTTRVRGVSLRNVISTSKSADGSTGQMVNSTAGVSYTMSRTGLSAGTLETGTPPAPVGSW